ncbi:MAG: YncE family protein [Blastocatellia bacterium]
MNIRPARLFSLCFILLLSFFLLRQYSPGKPESAVAAAQKERHLLYVAVPGIRNYLEFGGHGVLVYDIDDNYKLLRRIAAKGLDQNGLPLNVKGIAAHAGSARLYVTTTQTLSAFDLLTGKLLWEKPYEGGTDRLALSPDGKTIYLPSLEKDHWHVVDAMSGDIITKLVPKSGAHNTIYGPDGKSVFLAGLKSQMLSISDTSKHEITRAVGPFGASIRPFTINGSQTLAFVNVNELLGFEIGDIRTGKFLHRVEVQGFKQGPIKRHGCPSHGIGMTPDEKEIWVCDAYNQQLHIFDATVMPPKQVASIEVNDQPGWVTFSIDGRHAWPATGEVIDVKTRKVVTHLRDERGQAVQSEKMLEIDFAGDKPVRTGNQFGIGGKTGR